MNKVFSYGNQNILTKIGEEIRNLNPPDVEFYMREIFHVHLY